MPQGKPLVSVIVPFYNLHLEAARCLDSLLAQTFGGFEVVAVDDGSSDGTGGVLASFAGRDARVRAVSKPNGGLSDARNFGLRAARGDLVTFVDGDDVVSPRYLERLLAAVAGRGGAVAVATMREVPEADAEAGAVEWDAGSSFRVLGRAAFVGEFLANRVQESACGKLAPAAAYGGSFFPAGHLYEDLATFPALAASAEEFVVVESRDYGYVTRPGSISRTPAAGAAQARDYLAALDGLGALGVGPERLAYRRALARMRMRPLLKGAQDDPQAARAMLAEGLAEVRSGLRASLAQPGISAADKARLVLFAACPPAHDALLAAWRGAAR